MTYTPNYNLILVEGTDVVNPLVQLNPNISDIDTQMKANADASISPATCIKSGTTHTITRSNTSADVLRFTATGDWNAGDTMIVDGVTVTPYLANGDALIDKSYLINTEVLMSVTGTRATVYTNANIASNIEYSAGVTVASAIASAATSQGTSYRSGQSVRDALDAREVGSALASFSINGNPNDERISLTATKPDNSYSRVDFTINSIIFRSYDTDGTLLNTKSINWS